MTVISLLANVRLEISSTFAWLSLLFIVLQLWFFLALSSCSLAMALEVGLAICLFELPSSH